MAVECGDGGAGRRRRRYPLFALLSPLPDTALSLKESCTDCGSSSSCSHSSTCATLQLLGPTSSGMVAV